MNWNRCDICGRFIALNEFADGEASRNLVTPDSHYSSEEYETFHESCVLARRDLVSAGRDTVDRRAQ